MCSVRSNLLPIIYTIPSTNTSRGMPRHVCREKGQYYCTSPNSTEGKLMHVGKWAATNCKAESYFQRRHRIHQVSSSGWFDYWEWTGLCKVFPPTFTRKLVMNGEAFASLGSSAEVQHFTTYTCSFSPTGQNICRYWNRLRQKYLRGLFSSFGSHWNKHGDLRTIWPCVLSARTCLHQSRSGIEGFSEGVSLFVRFTSNLISSVSKEEL